MRIALAVAAVLGMASVVMADPSYAAVRKATNIAAQGLGPALKEFAESRDLQLLYFTDTVRHLSTAGAAGEITADEALTRILEGTGLTYRFLDEKTVTIVPIAAAVKSQTSASDRASLAPGAAMSADQARQTRKSATFWERFRLAHADLAGQETVASESSASGGAAGEVNGLALEEIVVTAQKRTERLQDVPMSIGVLSGAQLEEQGVADIHDLSYIMPSLSVRDTGPGQQLITIRGIGNGRGAGSLVGIYLDEAPLSSIPFSQIDLRANDLARVEVLRGPQGTIYGEGSVGGTLRFITNKPQLERASGSVGVGLSSTDSSDAMGSEFRGVVNLPLVEDQVAVRFAGLYEDASGWIDQPDAGREDINDYELREIRVSALWRPFDGLEVLGSSTIHRVDGGAQSLITGDPEDSEFRNPVNPTTRPFLVDDYDVHNLTLTYDAGFAQFVSSTTYMDKEAENFNFNLWQPVPAESPQIGLTSAARYSARTFSQEVRLSSREGSRLGWTAGLFYRDLHTEIGGLYDLAFVGVQVISPYLSTNTGGDSKSWAAFGDLNYELTERLKIGAGARYFQDDAAKFGIVNGTPEIEREASFDSFDPRIYATYAIAANTKLYVNAATGFRSGGFNGDAAVVGGVPATYGPEKLRSYEAGLKSVMMEGRLSANLSLFFSQYEDIQVIGIRPEVSVVSFTSNAGDAEVKGAELELHWRPVEHLSLGLNGSLIDTRYTRILTTPESSAQLPGDKIDLVPEYSYAVSATRTFALPGQDNKLALSVDYAVHDGSTETNRAAGLLQPIAESNTLNFLNAALRVQRSAWTFELFAQNLLDERDILMPANFGLISQARPRTYGVRLNYKP